MLKAVLRYGVPVEKQEEYFKFIREELKPTFEANGCRAYNVFREVARENNKDLVDEEQLITEIVFDDPAAQKKFVGQFHNSETWKGLLEKYHSWQTPSQPPQHWLTEV